MTKYENSTKKSMGRFFFPLNCQVFTSSTSKHHDENIVNGGISSGTGGVFWLSSGTPWFNLICEVRLRILFSTIYEIKTKKKLRAQYLNHSVRQVDQMMENLSVQVGVSYLVDVSKCTQHSFPQYYGHIRQPATNVSTSDHRLLIVFWH